MATVLIVEDEDQLRRNLTLYLACRGLTVAEAVNVETAIEALKAYATPFDVILLDINLPDGTGWDVLGYLRDRADGSATAFEARQQPRVIAVTAAQPAQCTLDEFELAAFLLKPFSMEVLVRLLDRVLAERPCAAAADRYEPSRSHAGCTGVAKARNQPACALDEPRVDVELDVADAFGDHDIEYWVRHGNKLVPAADDEIAQIREWERESPALARLSLWEQRQVHSGSGIGRLLHGLDAVRQRLGHSRRQVGSGDEQRQRWQHSPRAKAGVETSPRDL